MAKKEEINIEELQAKLASMLAEAEAIRAEAEAAKAEAKKLVEEARQAVNAKSVEDEEKARKAAEIAAEDEELVEVRLFKGRGYEDDVLVGVNGDFVRIKRGERVKIKRKFAKVLDASALQDYETSMLIEAATQTKKLADL